MGHGIFLRLLSVVLLVSVSAKDIQPPTEASIYEELDGCISVADTDLIFSGDVDSREACRAKCDMSVECAFYVHGWGESNYCVAHGGNNAGIDREHCKSRGPTGEDANVKTWHKKETITVSNLQYIIASEPAFLSMRYRAVSASKAASASPLRVSLGVTGCRLRGFVRSFAVSTCSEPQQYDGTMLECQKEAMKTEKSFVQMTAEGTCQIYDECNEAGTAEANTDQTLSAYEVVSIDGDTAFTFPLDGSENVLLELNCDDWVGKKSGVTKLSLDIQRGNQNPQAEQEIEVFVEDRRCIDGVLYMTEDKCDGKTGSSTSDAGYISCGTPEETASFCTRPGPHWTDSITKEYDASLTNAPFAPWINSQEVLRMQSGYYDRYTCDDVAFVEKNSADCTLTQTIMVDEPQLLGFKWEVKLSKGKKQVSKYSHKIFINGEGSTLKMIDTDHTMENEQVTYQDEAKFVTQLKADSIVIEARVTGSDTNGNTAPPEITSFKLFLDKDECKEDNGGCHSKRTCINQLGEANTCGDCESGWENVGEKQCENINECLGEDACMEGAVCTDTDGSYTCACPAGYDGDGSTEDCTEIDQCATNERGGCTDEQSCLSFPGVAKCFPQVVADSLKTEGGANNVFDTNGDVNATVTVLVNTDLFPANTAVSLVYGPLGDTQRYRCVNTSSSSENMTCALVIGSGGPTLHVSLAVTFEGNERFLLLDSAGSFGYVTPTITPETLCKFGNGCDSGDGSEELFSTTNLGELVQFKGTNFPLHDPPSIRMNEFKVTFEPTCKKSTCPQAEVRKCVLKPDKCTRDTIVCQTAEVSGLSKDERKMLFTVHVGSRSQDQVTGADKYVYPSNPEIFMVRGCQEGESNSASADRGTRNCPTTANTILTITGQNFGEKPEIFVGGKRLNVEKRNDTYIKAFLVEGSGPNLQVQVDNLDPIISSDNNTIPARTSSAHNGYLSYAEPEITEISSDGCKTDTDGMEFVECPRFGGANITLTGTNFGPSDIVSTIYIGFDKLCKNVQVKDHTQITCTIPPGNSRLDSLFIALGCVKLSSGVKLSYRQCPKGEYQQGLECFQCQPGRYTNLEGRENCTLCKGGDYTKKNASTSCEQCPAGHYSKPGSPKCTPCAKGSSCAVPGCPECKPCKKGEHINEEGASQCKFCMPGKAQEEEGMLWCKNCTPGTNAPGYSSTECSKCTGGSYQDLEGQEDCKPCAAGKKQPDDGQAQCDHCPRGRTNPNVAQQVCEPCEKGEYSSDDNQTCYKCDVGRFADSKEQAECKQCEPGKYANTNGEITCKPCLAGTYSQSPERVCTECPLGRFQPSQRAHTGCSICEVGKYSATVKAIDCVRCAVGKFKPGPPTDANGTVLEDAPITYQCEECERGRWQKTEGQGDCKDCPAGSTSGRKAEECRPCVGQHFAPDPATPACKLCPTLSIPDNKNTKCICSKGYYLFSGGIEKATTTEAPPSFTPELNDSASNLTTGPNANDMADLIGISTTFAPDGDLDLGSKSSNSSNSTNATGDQITTADIAETECRKCPDGAKCDVRGVTWETLESLSGYWRSDNQSLEFIRCLVPDHCKGGHNSKCQPHRGGKLCSKCDDGYTGVITCEQCPKNPGTSIGQASGIIIAMLFVLGLVFFAITRMAGNPAKLKKEEEDRVKKMERSRMKAVDHIRSRGHSKVSSRTGSRRFTNSKSSGVSTTNQGEMYFEEDDEKDVDMDLYLEQEVLKLHFNSLASRRSPSIVYKVKVLVSFCQIAFVIGYAHSIPWPLAFQRFINAFRWINFDFVPWDSLECIAPLPYFHRAIAVACMPILIMLLLYLFYFLPVWYIDKRDFNDSDEFRNKRRLNIARVYRIVFFTTFLLYPYVNSVVLGMYNCLPINDVYYLMAELELVCFSPTHLQQGFALAPFAIFYSFGIPALYGYFLYKNRNNLRDPYVHVKSGFIYESFNDSCWYFELVDMLHKLIQVSMISYLPAHLEMPFTMAVLALYICVILLVSPYIRKGDDRLQLFSLMYLYCMALVGYTLANVGQIDEFFDALVSALLISMVLALIGIAALISLRNVKKMVKFYLRSRKEKQMAKAHEEGGGSTRDPDKFNVDNLTHTRGDSVTISTSNTGSLRM